MDKLSFNLDHTVLKEIGLAVNEFHFASKSSFVRAAVWNQLKELNLERKKEAAWHKLLSAHKKIGRIQKWVYSSTIEGSPHRTRFGLKDLIRQKSELG
jgi:Arc/MetJ-type ribon-helix-helix transcriptional regulator